MLGLSGIKITEVTLLEDGTLTIHVESIKKGTRCHRCGKPIDHYHGSGKEIKLRHLPILDHKTYLIIKPKRYQCLDCTKKPVTTQKMDWYQPKAQQTKAFENYILRSLINSTIQDVSLKNDIGYDAVEGILDRYSSGEIDWGSLKRIDIIGIDEISLKKGHGDFVVIVSAYIEGALTVLAVLKDRSKLVVKKFFLNIPKRLRKTVKAICSDLYKGFINAAKEVFGRKVAVIADRFHVVKLYRDGLESLRKKEMKRLKNELSESDYRLLKNVMWMLRKQFNELTSDEQKTLNRLFILSPKLRQTYDFCNALTCIYNSDLTQGQAKRKIKGWMRQVRNSDLHCFDSFLKTLDNNMEEITSYFIKKQSSGFVEGLNNKIKVIKRRCYGVTNLTRLFKRIRLDLEGYAMLT